MSAVKVLIVGAGIGGLTAAIALARRGVEARVIERAPTFAPAGAGITLQPNATAVLDALGVAFDPADVLPMGSGSMVDARGRTLVGGAATRADDAFPALNIRRSDLHEALLAACGRERVRLGVELTALEPRPDGVRVRLSDGNEDDFDLVIGADGLRSAVRHAILPPEQCEPRYTGQTCWRLQLEAPDLAPATSLERWTPGHRVGVIPLSRGGIYVYLVRSAPRGAVGPGTDTVEYVQRGFKGLDERLDVLLARAAGDPSVLVHHGDLVDLPVYSTGRGRVVLLGDAAHAMTPNMGQGAAMAIEDAGALALLWTPGGPPADLPAALAAVRRARVEPIHRSSWRIGQMAHLHHPAARWLRDLLLRNLPNSMLERGVRQTWAPGLELAARLRDALA
ncbi:FAD-dependent monooxygenase [Nannocystis pusilla]|uniref:FAD-dependent monooxygenase n=1 Tax=Nannocystis pusilla TaxID=889268 RepID=A0ABS7U4V1_9BACT|nr:FAD-dependent monooxygenase [Nannocystis pusilla]MBZ5715434.1 FAD-dependent monooxygenase [Nannocystis pusilla]